MANPVDDLDRFTRDVLWMVTHWGPYGNSVSLCAEMNERGLAGDAEAIWLFTEQSLDLLDEIGLVTYRLGSLKSDPYQRIAATPDGYIAMGMQVYAREIGQTRSTGGRVVAQRPGDMTDWRNHGRYAKGDGPTERLTIRDHITRYWDHAELHFEQLWEYEDHEHERQDRSTHPDVA